MSKDNQYINQNKLAFVQRNAGRSIEMDMLPMPPEENFPFYPLNTYDDVDEPRWDPEIHLYTTEPEFYVRLDNWEKVKSIPSVKDNKDGTTESKLGFTAPYRLLSDEGVKQMLKILRREMALGREATSVRGSKRAVRGFWYTSPFIRDMMNCPKHLKLLETLTGEPVLPYMQLSNTPQINVSRPGCSKTLDHWHYDGLYYVSVLMLSDMSEVKGGALEVLKKNKFDGLNQLGSGEGIPESDKFTVNYEKPGMCILNHGSEVLHHVTPITHNPKQIERISVIMAFQPRNAYRPDKLVMHTMHQCDAHTKLYGYEYFRYKSWHMMHILKDFVLREKYVENGDKEYAEKLRDIAKELERAADLIEKPTSDKINFFHEEKKGMTTVHSDDRTRRSSEDRGRRTSAHSKDAETTTNINISNNFYNDFESLGKNKMILDTSRYQQVRVAPDVAEHFAF